MVTDLHIRHSRRSFNFKLNPIVRYITISDTVWYGAVGMLGPIFALFIADFIEGGGPGVAGIAAGVLLLSRSIVQIPFAAFLDSVRGDIDDFAFLFGFGMLASVVPLSYLFITTPLELYIAQFVLGAAIGASYPASLALLTRHIEPGREATTWSLYYTSVEIIAGLTAIVGGILATVAGFQSVIVGVVILSVIGTLLYIPAGLRIRTSGRRYTENGK